MYLLAEANYQVRFWKLFRSLKIALTHTPVGASIEIAWIGLVTDCKSKLHVKDLRGLCLTLITISRFENDPSDKNLKVTHTVKYAKIKHDIPGPDLYRCIKRKSQIPPSKLSMAFS